MGRFGKGALMSALALSLVCMLASSNVAMGQTEDLAPPPAGVDDSPPPPLVRSSPPSPVARSSPPSPVARSSPPSPRTTSSPPSGRSSPPPPTNQTSPPSPANDIISLKSAEAYSSSVAPCTKRYCLRRGLNHKCQNAIDGDLTTHFKSLPYKKDYDQWLGIKLDADYYITSVEFYTYAGHLVSRMQNLEVRAGLTKVLDVSESHKLKDNELVGEQDGVFENGRLYQVVLDKPVKACYVSFQNKPDYSNSESALAITEVVIHGYKNRKSSPPPPKRRTGGHPKGYKN